MFDLISQNPIWLLFTLVVTFGLLLTIIFPKEIKFVFSEKKILVLLLIFPVIELLSRTFSTTWILENKLNLFILIFIFSIPTAVLFGLLTKIILQSTRSENISIVKALSSITTWFISSLLCFWLGFGGNQLIFYFLSDWERPQRTFLCLIWTALTFALYPLLIADEGNPFLAVPRAFKTTAQTFHRWFYLFLIVIFVSGEFLQLFPSSSVRVSWLGAYSFQPIWFDWMIKSADLSPTIITGIYVVVIFVSSIIATLVKIKLTGILFDSPHISNDSGETPVI